MAMPFIIKEFENTWESFEDVLLYGRWYLQMTNKKTKKLGLVSIRIYYPTLFSEATEKEIQDLKKAAGTIYISRFFAEIEVLKEDSFRVSPRIIRESGIY